MLSPNNDYLPSNYSGLKSIKSLGPSHFSSKKVPRFSDVGQADGVKAKAKSPAYLKKC